MDLETSSDREFATSIVQVVSILYDSNDWNDDDGVVVSCSVGPVGISHYASLVLATSVVVRRTVQNSTTE